MFLLQSYFTLPKYFWLNSTQYFLTKIPSKQELHQIVFNPSSDIHFKYFLNLYKKCTAKPYSFLATDATLASDNPSSFRNNLLERILIIRLEMKTYYIMLTKKQ